jgi:hypothetical protein
LCDWSWPTPRDKVEGAFEKVALLELHDTVDMTDFSRLTGVYRLGKEKRKEEWTEIESVFVSAGPRPEKEAPAVPSDAQVAVVGNADEDGGTHGANSQSQKGTPMSLGSDTLLSCQQQAAEPESDFSSKQQNLHFEGDAETAKDNDLETKLAGESFFDDGGFDSDMDASPTGPEKEVKEEKELKGLLELDNGGFPRSGRKYASSKKPKVEKDPEVGPFWDNGGFTLHPSCEDADLEKLKGVPECDPWGFGPGLKKAKKQRAKKAKTEVGDVEKEIPECDCYATCRASIQV